MNSDERDLERAIDRYSASVAATAHASLKTLRTIFPGAILQVYERRQSLPIGIASSSGGGAVFSVVLYPRWVRLFFLQGVELDDPYGRLEGTGNQVRSVLIDADANVFDDPYIRSLIAQAVTNSGRDLRTGSSRVVFKSRILRAQTDVSTPSPRRSTTKPLLKPEMPDAAHAKVWVRPTPVRNRKSPLAE